MSRKHQLINSAINIMAHNRDGSYATRDDRRKVIIQSLKEIYAKGYQLNHVRYVKQKHIRWLVAHWRERQLSTGTVKNRLSHIRWLFAKINRELTVPSNEKLGIPQRVYVKNIDRSRELSQQDLSKVPDLLMRLSLEGQRLFGLRTEESLKIQPHIADVGNSLLIKSSWAKGGRERLIPILTQAQRDWLNTCKHITAMDQSLIAKNVSYKTYRKRFERVCEKAGIDSRHGLRHHYAQQRYQQLAGLPCVVKGGLKQKDMSVAQRQRDHAARLQVSLELGHTRINNITSQYLGR